MHSQHPGTDPQNLGAAASMGIPGCQSRLPISSGPFFSLIGHSEHLLQSGDSGFIKFLLERTLTLRRTSSISTSYAYVTMFHGKDKCTRRMIASGPVILGGKKHHRLVLVKSGLLNLFC